ncbi:YifB family Mg chelatase-like AAA ATPase [Bacillus rubiinfantis]|uniref:YifB family Mg chelatase-like AAA ATPase n=1 Tax=Bacillus rubiinfantis TaxID=1499680 RepID=UPI0009E4254C|nr:YifB family Mg chelatase-like AAA ATPase [Bacillus rubiinfantis]
MWACVTSIGLKGMDGYRLHVEVSTRVGPDSFKIVGLPDTAVKEAKERIIAALATLGYNVSGQKIIINLSPSDQKKMGSLFDLAMAIAVLKALHELDARVEETTGFLGALSLDGSVQPVEGLLPAILAAQKAGMKRLYLPYDENLPPLDITGLNLVYVQSLQDVIGHLTGESVPSVFVKKNPNRDDETSLRVQLEHPDFQQIVGHSNAKYALEVAAAGGHHVLITGPPGCGKSLLAWSFPTILAPLSQQARLEVLSLHQLSHTTYVTSTMPPFRNPHHSASGVSIIGGGQYPKPGEISLAHHGVLFLDEIGEFSKKTLDMLRQPLENGLITISRTHATITYPATFILLAAMNPCPCGYYGSRSHYCTCSPRQIQAYQNKLSGPLRDRFDIHLSLESVDWQESKLQDEGNIEPSAKIRKRVEQARERQYFRYGREICNSRVSYDELMKTTHLTASQQNTLKQLLIQKGLSTRSQIKIIRLSRTISDLQGGPLTDKCLEQAIQFGAWHPSWTNALICPRGADTLVFIGTGSHRDRWVASNLQAYISLHEQ